MIRSLFIAFLFACVTVTVSGQGGIPSVGEGTVIYKKQLVGGVTIHSEGWGGLFKISQHVTAKRHREWALQVVNMKHPKEFKTFNPYYDDSKGYVFGKEHAFMLVRPTWGQRQVLFDKMRMRGVEFGYAYAVGPSVGLAKPVYLEIGHPSVPYEYITVERYDAQEHFTDNIFGKAPGTRGLDELKVYPGLHTRFGLYFEYANVKDGVKALEAGIATDVYPQKVPIMAVVDNKQVFFTFYLNLMLGKKYFR